MQEDLKKAYSEVPEEFAIDTDLIIRKLDKITAAFSK